MSKNITIAQAKRIGIVAYLSEIGHHPVGFKQGEHLYLSPFREEKKPSFRVREGAGSSGEDVWHDFGKGGKSGGDIVVLAELLHKCSSTSDALQHLAEFENLQSLESNQNVSISQNSLFDQTNPSIEIVGSVRPLHHFVLLKYLREVRCIPDNLAKQYLKLIYYTHKRSLSDKPYFGFGWQNRSGAYEIRSAGQRQFKSVTGKKDISVFYPSSSSDKVYVFEGMLDYLSALVIKKVNRLNGLVIVLNGTALVKRIVPVLEGRNIGELHIFMDNDTAGQDALQTICNLYPDANLIPHTFYEGYDDVNDYLVNRSEAI